MLSPVILFWHVSRRLTVERFDYCHGCITELSGGLKELSQVSVSVRPTNEPAIVLTVLVMLLRAGLYGEGVADAILPSRELAVRLHRVHGDSFSGTVVPPPTVRDSDDGHGFIVVDPLASGGGFLNGRVPSYRDKIVYGVPIGIGFKHGILVLNHFWVSNGSLTNGASHVNPIVRYCVFPFNGGFGGDSGCCEPRIVILWFGVCGFRCYFHAHGVWSHGKIAVEPVKPQKASSVLSSSPVTHVKPTIVVVANGRNYRRLTVKLLAVG